MNDDQHPRRTSISLSSFLVESSSQQDQLEVSVISSSSFSSVASSESTVSGQDEARRAVSRESCLAEQQQSKKPSLISRYSHIFVSVSFQIIMNAAITIFGVGIGVGLILADSFRTPSPEQQRTSSIASGNNATATANESPTVMVSAATPACRATIRRAMDRIQEAPPLNLASMSQLPAQ